jgi:hypothetical protein
MFRFTIRDLLWLMVVVAVFLLWFCEMINHRGTMTKIWMEWLTGNH